VPRKRLDGALQSGAVDGVCYDRPEWVTVPLNWSQAVITNEILLVSAPGTAKPAKLEDVAGKTIGLVLGYQYPELDALGNNYLREDAPNVPSNTKKLMAGRVPYAVIDRLSLMYQEKLNPQIGPIAYLPITRIHAACGFSPASKIPFDEVNQAISRVINDGTVERILARYR
jgi:ABC-type amino acid transport substrate-binding protein